LRDLRGTHTLQTINWPYHFECFRDKKGAQDMRAFYSSEPRSNHGAAAITSATADVSFLP
jgi:hypothetical protein